MKTHLCTALALCLLLAAQASPRKSRALDFPRDDSMETQPDYTLQQDTIAQQDRQAAEAIRLESESGPRLTERRQGETFLEYRDRLEAARERLKNAPTPVDAEELREKQQEALYEAEYQLRKEEWGGTQSGPIYGQGAGPWGIRDERPLELQRVIALIENQRKEDALKAAAAAKASGNTEATVVEAEATPPEQEREEGSAVTP